MPKPSDQIEARAVDSITDLTPAGSQPATVFAEAIINGHTTTVRASEAEAKARGWRVLGPIHAPQPSPTHKSRTTAPPTPASAPSPSPSVPKPEPEPIGPEEEREALLEALNAFTVPELRDQATELGLEGTSNLRKAELIEELIKAHAGKE